MSTITTSLAITAQFAEMYLVAFECTNNDIVTMSSNTMSSYVHLRLNSRTIRVVGQLVAQNGTGNWGNVTDVVVTTCDSDYTPLVKFNYDGSPCELCFSHQRPLD